MSEIRFPRFLRLPGLSINLTWSGVRFIPTPHSLESLGHSVEIPKSGACEVLLAPRSTAGLRLATRFEDACDCGTVVSSPAHGVDSGRSGLGNKRRLEPELGEELKFSRD